MSIGIAIAIILLLLLVFLGLLLLGVGLVMLVVRSQAAVPAPPPARPVASPPARAPSPAPSPAAAKPEAPPLASSSGLLGFFDDEAYASPHPAGSEPREVEAAKTELFQRGKMAIDWGDDDEDSDEAEATEIFSAHGAAGDLAEFAFDDDDQSTGRFSS